ncbi:hypothetical protein WA026_002658 [Henosepilachna vigintioctopunctata]|uniref:SANT domain-containing protein n=1 Tax=Henosepilachna vigintioctopunctata TaxID=420089 RepID=A0AAW1U2Z7_9CUCU
MSGRGKSMKLNWLRLRKQFNSWVGSDNPEVRSPRPNNHAQNTVAGDIYKPSRSPVSSSTAGRYPYPSSPQIQHQATPNLSQRYSQANTSTVAYNAGPSTSYRDYRQPRISLLHPEYGRGRQEAPMLPGGQVGQLNVVHLEAAMGVQQLSQPLKKMRLQEPKETIQPLRIDTREQPGTYNPQVEAISPTFPENVQEDQAFRTTKDELIQQIGKVDREIAKAEAQILILKKKQQELEEVALRPQENNEVEEDTQPKHQSMAQKIYAENRKKAASAHGILESLGPKVDWPLYNQPTDTQVYHENQRKHAVFRPLLLNALRRRREEKESRNKVLAETYKQKMQEWLRKVEKIESSTKRKAKEVKYREFFEKVFPELRKQREDKERFNRVGARVKSEADMEEIMDNLQEQAMEDKKMRSYAVIPPILLDKRERDLRYKNNNGFVEDMEMEYKNRQCINMWTPQEKEIFKEKYLQHPKNFVMISSYLERKTVADCVHYYYTSKKTENYKRLLRKSRQKTRASKNTNKVNNSANSSVVDILTTGVTTRLQREQQQKTVVRDLPQNQESNPGTSVASSTCQLQTATSTVTSTNILQSVVTFSTSTASVSASSTTCSPLVSSSATTVISCSTPAAITSTSVLSTAADATTVSANVTVKREPSTSPPQAGAPPTEKFTDFNSFEEYNNQMKQAGQFHADEKVTSEGRQPTDGTTVKLEPNITIKKENETPSEIVSDHSVMNVVMENKKKKERRKDLENVPMETSEDDTRDVPGKFCVISKTHEQFFVTFDNS